MKIISALVFISWFSLFAAAIAPLGAFAATVVIRRINARRRNTGQVTSSSLSAPTRTPWPKPVRADGTGKCGHRAQGPA